MTGEQLILLGLLAAAFVAGWVAGTAREGKERPDPPTTPNTAVGNGRGPSALKGTVGDNPLRTPSRSAGRP